MNKKTVFSILILVLVVLLGVWYYTETQPGSKQESGAGATGTLPTPGNTTPSVNDKITRDVIREVTSQPPVDVDAQFKEVEDLLRSL